MPTNHWKNVPIPSVGDDLLKAWADYSDAIGVIVPAASVAAARVLLTKAEADGRGPTPEHPVAFLIHGIIYTSTGLKGSNNVWDLTPEGGRETYWMGLTKRSKTYIAAGVYAWQDKFTQAGVKPYDRLCKVTATMWAEAWDGVDLVVWVNGYEAYAAFPTGWLGDNSVGSSQTVTTWRLIPAGVEPDVWAGVRGRRPTSWVATDSNSAWASMIVEFAPVAMT